MTRTCPSMSPALDAVIFDCDGVLVDSSASYDRAILQVTATLLKQFAGVKVDWRGAGPRLVERLRMTGGFNNDWDSAYALVMFTAMAAAGPDPGMASRRKSSILAQVEECVDQVRRLGLADGAKAVEAVVSRADPDARAACLGLRRNLGYPGNPPESALASTFDGAYYGATLYRKLYGTDPKGSRRDGLIDREVILVREGTLRRLEEAFRGKIALLTGRTSEATAHTMGRLMKRFDLGSSIFIGDSALGGARGRELERYAKPSPLGLIEVMRRLGAKSAHYVGDSGEDVLMAEGAMKMGASVAFTGVCRGRGARSKKDFFLRHGADGTIRSVNELPARFA